MDSEVIELISNEILSASTSDTETLLIDYQDITSEEIEIRTQIREDCFLSFLDRKLKVIETLVELNKHGKHTP